MPGESQSEDRFERRATMIIQGIVLILQIIGGIVQTVVATRQVETHQKVETVQATVEEKASKVIQNQEEVKETLEEKNYKDFIKEGSQLYSNWVYLHDKALESGDQRDKDEATKAKKLLDEHNKKRPVPPVKSRPGGVP